MKMTKTVAVTATAAMLALTGCSAGGDDGGGKSESKGTSTGTLPPEGVAPDTSPMPMPKVGKLYNNPTDREQVKEGGTLTLPLGEIPPNFNGFSIDGNSVYLRKIDNWTSPSLWNFDVGGEASPDKDYLLSAKLINDKPETIKYTLNPEATWNNGDPITWKALETTWKTQSGNTDKYNPASTTGYSKIKSVKKGDTAKEAIVTFDQPFYPYKTIFAQLEHPKNLDPEFYKKGWVNDPHNELRAGPFKVKKHSKTKIVLVPNPKWWGDKPKLDKVVYRQLEPTASINAFQNGGIDAAEIGSADRMAQIKDMENVKVRRGFNNKVAVYTIGQDSELFTHKYARKAFMLSTDRKQLAEINFQGMNWDAEAPGSQVLYPWMPTYEDNLGDFGYDVEKAKQVMKDHGWTMGEDGYFTKDGQVAEFTYVNFGNDPNNAALARAQQAMSKKAGLKMKIDNRKSSAFSTTITEGSFDVVIMAWSQSDPYGYAWACQLYCSDSESNFTGVGTEEIDKMMKKVTTVSDQQEAIELANQAESKALKLRGALPLFNGPEQIAVAEGLANYGPSGWLVEEPTNVGWEK